MFINGCDQGDGSWSFQRMLLLTKVSICLCFAKCLLINLPDYVFPGSVSPPQQPKVMPTEEISPLLVIHLLTIAVVVLYIYIHIYYIYPELDIHGHGAQLPMNRGAEETNLKEAPRPAKLMLTREQSPCSWNASIHRCAQEDGCWVMCINGLLLLKKVAIFLCLLLINRRIVFPGIVYPPQQLHDAYGGHTSFLLQLTQEYRYWFFITSLFASLPPCASGGTFDISIPKTSRGNPLESKFSNSIFKASLQSFRMKIFSSTV